MTKRFVALFLSIFSIVCFAEIEKPLSVDEAFKLKGYVKNENTVVLEWTIAPDYYLYKDRFSYKITNPDDATIGKIEMPASIMKQDELLGNYHAYQNTLTLELPITSPTIPTQLNLKVCYQGCSEKGFCYPPQTKLLRFNLKDTQQTQVTPQAIIQLKSKKVATHDKISNLLIDGNIWLIIISFLGFGLLLSLTPCVLPMIPILSGIILGHKETLSTTKAFLLSSTYVLGMAIMYALIGIVAGFAGQSIQAALQTPLIIAIFSGFFVLLALSLFGVYEIKLPSRFEKNISDLSNQQKSGTYFGVAIMGLLATLIVSPCVTAPLVGALAYIAKTGDALLGGIALFMLGIGMGIPLILIGTSHGKLLPRAGKWMDTVKAFFGVLLLATAIWMLSRVIPAQITMFLWAVLLLISAVYLGLFSPHRHHGWGNFWRGLGFVFAVYGIILMIGAALGNTNPLQPLRTSQAIHAVPQQMEQTTSFKNVNSVEDVTRIIQKNKKLTLLDFYADWCISCKDMDYHVFSDPKVNQKLKSIDMLRADVTANDLTDRTLQEHYRVIAPPTILFFDREGNELSNYRIVGEITREEFLKHLSELENDHRN